MKRILVLGVILVILNALDVVTTMWVIGLGGSEANPIADHFIQNGGLWVIKMGVSTFVALWLLFAVWKSPQLYRFSRNALIALNAFYVTPIIWNLFGVLVLEGIVKI